VADVGLKAESVDVGGPAADVGHEVDRVLAPEVVGALHHMVVVHHQLRRLRIAAGHQLGPTGHHQQQNKPISPFKKKQKKQNNK
jgi:hypothetical protein